MEEMGSVLRNFEEKRKTLVLAVLQNRKLLEYQPIMWLVQCSVLTDGCISIAEPHCEVNLTIVSVEHRIEAVRNDNILNRSNMSQCLSISALLP